MKKLLLLVVLHITFYNYVSAQSFVFAQLTGSPVNTTGWNLTGNAYVGNTPVGSGNQEILLTDPVNGQSGAIFYNEPINIVQCDRWSVEFDMRMFDGNGADGIAFCLLDVPPSGFVGGGGCGIPASSNGLKIVFDSFDNCGGPNPNIQIRYGAGYFGGECNYSQPTLENTSGQLSFLRSNNYNHVQIDYLAGNILVRVNGTVFLTGFYNITFTTYAGFTSSTGGLNDRQSIKNVVIRTDMAQPVAYSGPNAATCSGSPIQIGSTPDPTYQYTWTPTTGLNNPTIGNPTLTLTNPGPLPITVMYKVGANIVGSPNCKKYDSVYVTIYPIPNTTFTTDAPQYCVSQTAIITYTGFATPAATYTWDFDGGSIIAGSGQGPYQVKWNTPGVKNITLDVSENGCNSTIQGSQQVTIYAIPTSTFTLNPATSACENAPVTVQYTGSASTAANYNWNFNGGTVGSGSGQGPYSISWPTTGNPTVSLTVTENGCTSNPTQVPITIYPIPTATFTAQSPVCDQQASQVSYTGSASSNANYTWGWDGGAATQGTGQSYSVVWIGAGIKNVTLTVDENGCTSVPVTVPVTVYPIPTSTFTLSTGVCAAANAQAAYTGTATPAATYTWGWNGGTASSTGGENYNVNWANAGNYTVSLTVTENGCTSTQSTQNITVYPIPTAAFNAVSPICDQQSSTINYVGTGSSNATYTWNWDGGNATQTVGENYTTVWPSIGTKNVSLIVTENGCSSVPVSQQITIYPIPTATFTATPVICQPDFAQVNYTGTGTGNAAYNWTFSGGNATNTGGETYDVNWNTPGQYTISLEVTENGCISTIGTQNVTVNYQPTASFSALSEVCVENTLTITYTGNAPPSATYNWDVDGGVMTGAGQGPITSTWSIPGEKSISLNVSQNGCSSTISRSIQVIPVPTIPLAPTYNLCIGQEVILDAGDGDTYTWSSGETGRKIVATMPGNYTVTVVDQYGCTASASTVLLDNVCISVYVPNAFTPNGDGKNEVFKPEVLYPLTYTMRVYNRWGQLVYLAENDANAYWDGSSAGLLCPADVYVYYIEYTGYDGPRIISGKETGKVALIR